MIRERVVNQRLIRKKGEMYGCKRVESIRRTRKGYFRVVQFKKTEMAEKSPAKPPLVHKISEEEARQSCTPRIWDILCPEWQERIERNRQRTIANTLMEQVQKMDILDLERFVNRGGEL